jgi:hypothetical protein
MKVGMFGVVVVGKRLHVPGVHAQGDGLASTYNITSLGYKALLAFMSLSG